MDIPRHAMSDLPVRGLGRKYAEMVTLKEVLIPSFLESEADAGDQINSYVRTYGVHPVRPNKPSLRALIPIPPTISVDFRWFRRVHHFADGEGTPSRNTQRVDCANTRNAKGHLVIGLTSLVPVFVFYRGFS